jgi:hypothetical protein
MNAARVELMASVAGKIGGVTWHHLFLVAADASGKLSYLRAGPQNLPLERLAGRKTQHGDALEEHEPSPAGAFGFITISAGAYEPGGVDFDPVAANVTLASAAAAGELWDKVQKAAQALQEDEIVYEPLGRCANWAIMEALRRCGVHAPLPPKRWAPGAGVLASDPVLQGVSARRIGQAVMR